MKPRKQTPNAKPAPKVKINPLNILQGLLVLVGKPFYLTLTYLIISAFYLLSFVGRLTRFLSARLYQYLTRPIPPEPKAPPRFRKLPSGLATGLRITLSKLKSLRLLWLKAQLFFVKISRRRLKLSAKLKFALFVFSLLLITSYFLLFRGLPSPKTLVTREQEISTKIYDRNGILLYKIYKDKNRTLVRLEQVPTHVRLAILAAEDAEFYAHPGISIRGIIRSSYRNLTRGELTGGSTITQQLVKNALLTPEKTIVRKVREVILSVGVELAFTKDQILEMYLNEVPYGGTAYGIQEAAKQYFDKNVWDLNLAEAAMLAGLPKSPTRFSPFGENPESAFLRQREVLRLMRINKYITEDEEKEASSRKVTFAPNRIEIKAPHFVMYVRGQLVDKYGEETVETGGLEVVTTLDYQIQKLAEGVVAGEVEKLKNLNVGNGAAVVLNPQTGEILAMVGSKNYFDAAADGNVNVALRPRLPGSSIKVVNYAYALSNGYTAASIISDSPVTYAVPGQPPYSPKNYDGEYRGSITLRSAFAESRNIPAVKVLASYGVTKMIGLGKKMGITTWEEENRFGLSLTLGGGEVRLIDLARAYATVANLGRRPEITSVKEVKNYKGKVLEQNKCLVNQDCRGEQVLDPRVAFILVDILRDNVARAPSFGSSSRLLVSNHPDVAVKTGTSNDLKDNLTVGFNQKYLVAVWVGNNDNSPMTRVASGVTGAAPIWNKIVSALLASEPVSEWVPPEGLVRLPVCLLTGTLACKGCAGRPEWFIEEKAPSRACSEAEIARILKEQNRQKMPPTEGLRPRGSGQEGQLLEPAAVFP